MEYEADRVYLLQEESKNEIFKGVDEQMELEDTDKATLMQFETLQITKNGEAQGEGANPNEIEFDKVKVADLGIKKDEYRKIPVPRHRFTPLKQNWDSILKTLVEHMKLQVRMNTKRRAVELKVSQLQLQVNYF